MIRYTPTEAGQTEILTADPLNHIYAMEAEMDGKDPLEWKGRTRLAAPGTEPPRQARGTPGVYVFLAGVGYGFVMGIALTVILS